MYTAIFERVEKKYLLTPRQYERLLPVLQEFLTPDEYGETAVCSLYLDTPDNLLVRRSIEKPAYKEKLRLRSYGVPNDGSEVFLEIKKKTGGVVYKRRVSCTAQRAMAYAQGGDPPCAPCQIFGEIDYMRRRYGLVPRAFLAYDRTAWLEREATPDALRVTFDRRLRTRESDVDPRMGDAGRLLLPDGARLMELKTALALPVWLCEALSRIGAYPTSFSKYGQAYQSQLDRLSAHATTAHSRAFAAPFSTQGGTRHAYSPV